MEFKAPVRGGRDEQRGVDKPVSSWGDEQRLQNPEQLADQAVQRLCTGLQLAD